MRAAREKGVELLFPSGNTYRVRRPTAAGMLRRGDLPNPLLAFLVDVFYNGANSGKVDEFLSAQDKRENALGTMESLRVVCEEAFLDPRIVAFPDSDADVTIDDVPMEDQVWMFQATFLGVNDLRPFRNESPIAVESVPGTENVPPSSE